MKKKNKVLVILSIIGPGLITVNAGNDAGGIATYATVGASYGYKILWGLLLITFSLATISLRQNVQRALNRGESYHKLRRAISYGNFGKLRFKTEQNQNIWGECSRLIANCIIYYNASILSNMLVYKETNGQDSDVLKHISPVAWQHINFYGRYSFNTSSESINMDEIILELAKFQIISNE